MATTAVRIPEARNNGITSRHSAHMIHHLRASTTDEPAAQAGESERV
jgi:hypothetical protein